MKKKKNKKKKKKKNMYHQNSLIFVAPTPFKKDNSRLQKNYCIGLIYNIFKIFIVNK